MTPPQQQFYDSLEDEEKLIINVALFIAGNVTSRAISQHITPFSKKYISDAKIKKALAAAAKAGFFVQTLFYREEYCAKTDVLIAYFPKLERYKAIKANLKPDPMRFWYDKASDFAEQLRDMLYALLFQQKEYPDAENEFCYKYDEDNVLRVYFQIVNNTDYASVIRYINTDMLEYICGIRVIRSLEDLESPTVIEQQINYFRELCKSSTTFENERVILKYIQNIRKGIFHQNIELEGINLCDPLFLDMALRSEPLKAVKLAEQNLKVLKKTGPNNFPFYVSNTDVYYYILTLLQTDSKTYIPILDRVIKWKNKYADKEIALPFQAQFYAIISDVALQDKTQNNSYIAEIPKSITDGSRPIMLRLYNTLIYYVLGKSLGNNQYDTLTKLMQRTLEGEDYLAAYELAYVMHQWYNNADTKKRLNDLSAQFDFTPMISRINIVSEWEKTLNLLLSMEKGTKQKAVTNEKNKRVAYALNPNNLTLQPVLQSKQAKGWSNGRNIALPTFIKGDVEGMTEQDLRASKCVIMHTVGFYNFSRKIYVELIGHPYIFLDGTDLPVEFVEARPHVSVKETSKGYALKVDLGDVRHDIELIKETNTRYKVYHITPKQREMISILNHGNIVVPKQGKNKLTEVLGVFSAAGMTVHSDLINTEGSAANVKRVKTDSRIRIQLLPYGDGLKAELYSKPFGTQPPYCKPGKGGKALIGGDGDKQLQVERNLKEESNNEQTLMNDIQALDTLEINDGLMSFGDPLDALQLLEIAGQHTDISVVEWPEGERMKLRNAANSGNLSLNIKSGINWFELSGELKVSDDIVLTLQQLLALTEKSHQRFIELKPGEYLALSAKLKKQLDAINLFSTEEKGKRHLNRFASVALEGVFDELPHLKTDKKWKEFKSKLENLPSTVTPIPADLQAELRPYQEDGFRWMSRLAAWNAGACLADEMGLGKTLQTLAVLLDRADKGAALVVCPVSLIGNWLAEAEHFAPSLNVKVLSTVGNGRREILQTLKKSDLLVTSYGLLQSEEKLFAEVEFATIVLDEAHIIKNYATKTSKATMNLKGDFRIALTGTPVQNHSGEIWNLFNFINPGLLGSLKHFNETFIKADNEQNHKYLKKLIAPFILRRTKSNVIDELPPKTEIVKRIALSDEEMAFYEVLRRQAIEHLSNSDASAGAKHIQVLAEITRLRQACCNARLIEPDVKIPSAKLSTFMDLVSELRENKHRTLVFSQFVTHLTLVREVLDKQGITYQYIDGSTPAKERQKRVDAFQNGEGELFLISLKAGGLGLNLTAADYVIHLDPWWNPAIEDQASDRAHRIGQKRPVTIYRLVAENTIEEKIIQLHSRKRDLAESLLEGSDQAAKLSPEEIMALIKSEV